MDIAKKGSIIADFSQSAGSVNKMLHCSNYMPCISQQNILNFNDDYAKMYTKLSKNAIDTEFPTFGTNTNNSTVKVTNYFELEEDNNTYNIFLIADFDKDKYYLKIGGFKD